MINYLLNQPAINTKVVLNNPSMLKRIKNDKDISKLFNLYFINKKLIDKNKIQIKINTINDSGNLQANKFCPKILKIHNFLGKGSYGRVYLVENIINHEFYAMKVMKKEISESFNLNFLYYFSFIFLKAKIFIKNK